jgi:hypothetical protein
VADGRHTGVRLALVALVALAALGPARSAAAQERIAISGDRLSGFVLPVEPLSGPIELRATRGDAWTVDDTKRLRLDGDVLVRIGPHRFEASKAVIWLNRLPSAGGVINQVAMFFDEVTNPSAAAGIGVSGRDLLVTASARGPVTLEVSILQPRRPRSDRLLRLAENRLAEHLARLAATTPALAQRPVVEYPLPPLPFRPEVGGRVTDADVDLPTVIDLPPPAERAPWLRAPQSTIRFSAGRTELVPGDEENTIRITGSVWIEYASLDLADPFTRMTLAAQRAVIFTDPGSLEDMARGQVDATKVRGIYLEGGVVATAGDGDYTVRTPRAYYDFRTGRAVMVDAVLRTYDRNTRLPVFARATELRQVAESQWEADSVRVTTSEFKTGHVALGAERMTVTRRPIAGDDDPDARETFIESADNTLRLGGVPVVWWPRFAGTVKDVPLQSASIGYEDNDGARIETRWNLFTLLGREAPDGVNVSLILDAFTKRGAGGGVDIDYELGNGDGRIELYGMYDDGTDKTSAGEDVEQDEDFRGLAVTESQWKLTQHWSAQVQSSLISDETFISTWREDDFQDRREFETAGLLKYQKDDLALTLLGKYEPNDFLSNDYLLASRGYQVERLPEGALHILGKSLFGDRVTWSVQTRVGRVKFHFEQSTPNELGIPATAFPGGPNTPVEDFFLASGFPTKTLTRIDSRHEIAMPMTMFEILKVVPFLVGRITRYSDDFQDFSGDDEDTRIFGAAGVTITTQFHRIDNAVENRLLDLHRLRHIIEPSVTFWYGTSNLEQFELPEYDVAVESLATGSAVRLGLRNVWQTQRGGPGRWRSVDVLTIDTSAVFDSDDGGRESPTPQFFDYRPEYSQFGDHVHGEAVWLVSDGLAVVGEGTYDMDESVFARGSIGAELRHNPQLSTHIEYRFIDASDNELLGIGWTYWLTTRYKLDLRPDIDLRNDRFRAVGLTITRRFPEFDLSVKLRYDDIRDDTSVGASIGLVEF